MRHLVIAILFLALLVGSFLAGSWYRQGEKAKVYPPEMKSSTVSAGTKPDTAADADMDASSLPPGTVSITPEKQQMIGVRTRLVEKAPVEHFVRTVGRVAPDEKRVYRLVAGTDGWIRETYNNDTGTLVKKDERLASFYSPQFRAAQLAYLSIFSSPDSRFPATGRPGLAPSQQASITLQTYIDALESLGMSEQQMKELAGTKQITDRVFILAPVTGFIIARNVSPGQQFEKGAEWYQIANLDRVWVLADLFPIEAVDTKPGMKVRVILTDRKKEFHATVATVLPQFDPNSRTLKVRLELDNPDYVLRPDMFVDVEFPVTRPPALTVPADAILDSGLRKTVFVDRGNGFFEPRRVRTGWRLGGQVEITRGLMPGERVVISGNFLIDSESRMDLAALGAGIKTSDDPVCGRYVDKDEAEASNRIATYANETFYFCSDPCKEEFEKEPEKYIAAEGAERVEAAGTAMPEECHSDSEMKKDESEALDADEHAMHGTGMMKEEPGGAAKTGATAAKEHGEKDMGEKPQAAMPGMDDAPVQTGEDASPFPGGQNPGSELHEPAPAEGEPHAHGSHPKEPEIPAAPPSEMHLKPEHSGEEKDCH